MERRCCRVCSFDNALIRQFLSKILGILNNCSVICQKLKQMQTGTVKFFNESKGFGFISPENGGEDIFVHISGLVDSVRQDDKVLFDVAQGKRGLNAVNVKLA